MLDAAETFITGQGIENVSYRLADAENLPFDEHRFDLVTCRAAPHHFPDCARFVRQCARVLKPGGMLLVQDHVLPEEDVAGRYVDGFEKLRDPSHNRALSTSEWVSIFEAGGLKVEHIEEIIRRHGFISWAELQGNSEQVIAQLVEMMREAPDPVVEWMQPTDWGTPGASFANHHLIIAGRKELTT
jgi:ubiquinone/menaquinone biosynthesis C-methylase UbiE